jgi:hypothetical protein
MLDKLSTLQKFILVSLIVPQRALLPRRKFSQEIYCYYFGQETPSTRASLSRAYRRLEERGFLIRSKSCWRLTQELSDDNGLVVGILALHEFVEEAKAKGKVHPVIREAWEAAGKMMPKSEP